MQATPASPEPLALTVNDTAAELSCSRATVYRLINEGKLKTFKVGRLRRVLTTSIHDLANENVE